MSAMEKSDLPEVAEKRANKAASAAAELVERRGGTKENAELQSRVRTQSRGSTGGTMQPGSHLAF
jgi:RNA-directed DNA polymerase